MEIDPAVQERLRIIAGLHRAGFSYARIDEITRLGWRPETTRDTVKQFSSHWRIYEQAHLDDCIAEYHRFKVTVYEHLSVSAPECVRQDREIIMDPEASETAKREARKSIFNWTALCLKTDKISKAQDDLLTGPQKEAAEAGEELLSTMESIMRDTSLEAN